MTNSQNTFASIVIVNLQEVTGSLVARMINFSLLVPPGQSYGQYLRLIINMLYWEWAIKWVLFIHSFSGTDWSTVGSQGHRPWGRNKWLLNIQNVLTFTSVCFTIFKQICRTINIPPTVTLSYSQLLCSIVNMLKLHYTGQQVKIILYKFLRVL